MTQENTNACCAPAEPVKKHAKRPAYAPRADILETKEALILVADMPGVSQESIEISLDRNTLTVTGWADAPAPDGMRLLHREYEPGSYRRSFTLSDSVDREKIEAKVKDGVLRVTLPKSAQVKPRKIPVALEN